MHADVGVHKVVRSFPTTREAITGLNWAFAALDKATASELEQMIASGKDFDAREALGVALGSQISGAVTVAIYVTAAGQQATLGFACDGEQALAGPGP